MENEIYFSNFRVYQDIVINNYGLYTDIKKNLKNTIDQALYDCAVSSIMHQYTIQIVVFSALSIEAFLNDYLLRYLGENYFNLIDSYDIKSKLLIGVKMITDKNFPKDGSAYSYLSRLITLRNKLVHCKSIRYELGRSLDNLKKYNVFKDSDIEHSIKVYDLIVSELCNLHPNIDEYYVKIATLNNIKFREISDS